MIQIKNKIIFSLSVFLFLLTSIGLNGFTTTANANDISTSVNVLPNLQTGLQIKGESYINYDVTGMDGQTINSSMEVKNLKNEEVKVSISISNGLTNRSDVSYEPNKKNSYSGFLDKGYIMEDIITDYPETITLKPNETKTVNFNINVPNKLKGQYIGLIRFEDIERNKAQKRDSTIELKIAYSMGVWIKGEDAEIKEAEVDDVKLDKNSSKPVILAKFLNKNPHFLKDQKVEYKVYKIGKNKKDLELIFEDKKKQPIISPKNYFWYPIEWNGKVSPGKYQIDINGKTFFFEIKKDQLPEEDENTLLVERDNIPLWVWLIIGLLLLIILYLLFKRKKDEKDEDEENETEDDNDESVNDEKKNTNKDEGDNINKDIDVKNNTE